MSNDVTPNHYTETDMTAKPLTQQDQAYATGSSRFAFAHAAHYVEFRDAGNKKLANYHRREVVEIAEWLEAGLKAASENYGGSVLA